MHDHRRSNVLGWRGRNKGGDRTRRALPPLYGKDVEILSILRKVQVMGDTFAYVATLVIDNRKYVIDFIAKDETEVLKRLLLMQARKPRSAFDEDT